MKINYTKTDNTGNVMGYASLTLTSAGEGKVSLTKVTDTGSVKAYFTLNVTDADTSAIVAINGCKLMEGSKGTFISMPNRKDTKGEYKDIAFPLSPEGREAIKKLALEAYNAADASEDKKGTATGELPGDYVVTGVKLVKKNDSDETFVSMPQRKANDGTYKDVCYPVTKEGRDYIVNGVKGEAALV